MAVQEPFAQGSSLLHGLDARAKFVGAFVYSVVVAVVGDFLVLVLAVLFSLALLGAARLDTARLVRRLVVINAFIAFLWLFLPWSVPGTIVAEVGPIEITREGVLLALQVTCGHVLRCWARRGSLTWRMRCARCVCPRSSSWCSFSVSATSR